MRFLLIVLLSSASWGVGAAEALDLRDLIGLSVDKNPQILSQKANIRSSQASLRAAGWQYYPTASMSVEGVSSPSVDTTYASGSRVQVLRVQQPLYTWGRLTAGVSKATAQAASAEASLDETKQQVALRVVQAYVDGLSALQRMRAYREGYVAHEGFLRLISRRIEQGISSKSEMVLVKSRLEQMKSDEVASAAAHSVALSHLTQLVGTELKSTNINYETGDLRWRVPAATLLPRAINQSPTLGRLSAQALVTKWEMEEQAASLYPEVYMRLERQVGNYSAALASLGPVNRVFVGMSASLGAGLSSSERINALQARYDAAQEDVQAGVRSVSDQIVSDAEQLEATQRRVAALEVVAAQSRELVTGGERQFLAGKKSWQDLMNASREQVQAEVQLADAKASVLLLKWRLSLYTDPVDQVIDGSYFSSLGQSFESQ